MHRHSIIAGFMYDANSELDYPQRARLAMGETVASSAMTDSSVVSTVVSGEVYAGAEQDTERGSSGHAAHYAYEASYDEDENLTVEVEV